MTNLSSLTVLNAKRWRTAKLTRDASGPARRLVAARARYQSVSATTGVPWFVIAVIHMRESAQDWRRSLAQGDPWDRVSTHVPKGRGPFRSWEDAAIDALAGCPPYAARWRDWSAGGALTLIEQYNGLGYARRGQPSPYLWAGTDQYSRGKYVADGRFDPQVVDPQPGCAALLRAMQQLDAAIGFGIPAATAVAAVAAAPAAPAPSIANPAPGSLGAWIASFFRKGK